MGERVTIDQLKAARARRLQSEGVHGFPIREAGSFGAPAEVTPLFGVRKSGIEGLLNNLGTVISQGEVPELGGFSARVQYHEELVEAFGIRNKDRRNRAIGEAAKAVIFDSLDHLDDPLWQELRSEAVDELTKAFGPRAARMVENVRITHETMRRKQAMQPAQPTEE